MPRLEGQGSDDLHECRRDGSVGPVENQTSGALIDEPGHFAAEALLKAMPLGRALEASARGGDE